MEVTLERVTQYALGALADARLTFTDAALAPSRAASTSASAIAYLASAERSPDAVRDGVVVGSALGVIAQGVARYAPLLDASFGPLVEKAEGLAFDALDPRRAFVVLDGDDPTRPSELCTLALDGPWW